MTKTVAPLHLANVTYPETHPRSGVGPVFAFLVHAGGAIVLVDTGIGPPHPVIDRLYNPLRFPLVDALASNDVAPSGVTAIVNTHLHFDHIGANARFPGVPIFVQAAEYASSRKPGYTVPDLVDFEGADYQLLDGDAGIAPGIRLIATPGHTPGHQSVIVDADNGPIVIAGQFVETAEESIEFPQRHPHAAAIAARIINLAPARVYFSHDTTFWEPTMAM